MAYRGARKIISQRGSGGGVLTLHIIDGPADLPAASGGAIGDRAYGIAGDADGKSWEIQQDSGGRAWVEVTPGNADGYINFTGGASEWTQLRASATTDRTITFPDADGTVALLNASQTLTAKTLSRSRLDPLTVSQIAALTSPLVGEQVYADDGRKPGEGSGSGTGVPAFFDGSAWHSCCDGLPLVA